MNPGTVAEIFRWVRLLVELGFEVYRAASNGEHDRTVGEIFKGREADLEYLRGRAEAARAFFADKA